jgi:hypothetical protein
LQADKEQHWLFRDELALHANAAHLLKCAAVPRSGFCEVLTGFSLELDHSISAIDAFLKIRTD